MGPTQEDSLFRMSLGRRELFPNKYLRFADVPLEVLGDKTHR